MTTRDPYPPLPASALAEGLRRESPAKDDVLLPCPFCGGDAALEHVEDPIAILRWSVGCNETDEDDGGSAFSVLCYGYQSLTTFGTKAEAIAAWNRRAVNTHEARDALIAELVTALKHTVHLLMAARLPAAKDAGGTIGAAFLLDCDETLERARAALAKAKAKGEGK